MSFNKLQFKMVVLDALESIEDAIPVSDAALNLLVGTAAQESHYGTYLRQLDEGPALGVFQMEPATHDDIWRNFLAHRRVFMRHIGEAIDTQIIYERTGDWTSPPSHRLIWDLRYSAIMCRIHYYRVPAPLPAWDDVNGLADYWKEHYNTHLGAGTVDEFIENYGKFVL